MTSIDITTEQPQTLITEGTRALDAKHKPTELAVGSYCIPNSLNHCEYEDLAARIITICQEAGQFVAPAYSAIGEQILTELQEIEKREATKKQQNAAPSSEGFILQIRKGLSRLLGQKTVETQKEQVTEQAQAPLPYSVLTFACRFDPRIFPQELHGMVEKGYIKLITKGETDYLEPTEKLIEDILTAQRNRG